VLNFVSKKNKKAVKKKSGSSQNPKILEVNLIKNEMQIAFDWNRHLGTLLFAVVVTMLFVAEIYIGLNWWTDYEGKRVLASEEKFNQVSQNIRDLKTESNEILAFKKRVDAADSLLENHIYWTNFLNWLEKNTLSTVTYSGISGGIDGVYDLAATANAFREVSWQTRAFMADSSVISVRVDQASLQKSDNVEGDTSSDTVGFSLNLEVNPQIFKTNLK
jgi:hypothetical protein